MLFNFILPFPISDQESIRAYLWCFSIRSSECWSLLDNLEGSMQLSGRHHGPIEEHLLLLDKWAGADVKKKNVFYCIYVNKNFIGCFFIFIFNKV